MAHPNEIPDYRLSQADVDQLIEQSAREALRRKEQAAAAERWPTEVTNALRLLSGKVELLTSRVAELEGASS